MNAYIGGTVNGSDVSDTNLRDFDNVEAFCFAIAHQVFHALCSPVPRAFEVKDGRVDISIQIAQEIPKP